MAAVQTPRRRARFLAPVLVAALAAGGLGAFVTLRADDNPAVTPDRVVVAHGADTLPFRNSADWVSYADAVVVVTVASERRIEPTAEEIAIGEGLVGRTLTLDVDDVLWQSKTGDAAPSTFEIDAAGWVLEDGKEVPLVIHEAPRLAVGETLVIPLFRDGDAWSILSPRAVLVLDHDRSFEPGQSHVAETLAAEIRSGRSAQERGNRPDAPALTGLLQRAQPHEAVRPHLDKEPRDRWAAAKPQQ